MDKLVKAIKQKERNKKAIYQNKTKYVAQTSESDLVKEDKN